MNLKRSQENTSGGVKPVGSGSRSKWLYGSNALLLAIAALIVVILVDWITFRYNQSYDLTTGQIYSLSPQTRRLLSLLEKSKTRITFVNTFPSSSQADELELTEHARVEQLIHEYERASAYVHQYRPPSRKALETLIQKHFGNRLKPYEQRLAGGIGLLVKLEKNFKQMSASLLLVNSVKRMSRDQSAELINIAGYFSHEAPAELRRLAKNIKHEKHSTLADWPALAKRTGHVLHRIASNLKVATTKSMIAVLAPEYQVWLKGQIPAIRKMRQLIGSYVASLHALKPVKSAAALADIGPDRLLIISPQAVKAVTAGEMFNARLGAKHGSHQLRYSFNGEEAINGKLLSILHPQKIKVVFVTAEPMPLTSAGGPFSAIARKLQRNNFSVLQWSPISSNPQMPGPSGPPPAIGKGVIWVVLSIPPSGQMGMMEMQAAGQLDEQVRRQLQMGGSALFLVGAMPTQLLMASGGKAPFKELLASYGIRYRPNLVVVSRQSDGQGHSVVGPQVRMTRFPKNVITAPMNSLLTMFMGLPNSGAAAVMGPTVVGLTTAAPAGITRQVILRSPGGLDVWAQSADAPFKSHFNAAEDTRGSMPLGALAKKGASRVVAIGNVLFIFNGLLESAETLETGRSFRNILEFPGNSALFMNSMYWLSGQSKLIAASPRATVAMRIAPMSASAVTQVRIFTFAGPAAIAAILGIVVLMMRRRV